MVGDKHPRASAIAPDEDNRRNHERFDVQIRSVVAQELGADASDMLMSNLSLGGCFLRCTTPEAPGSLVLVSFRLPSTDGPSPIIKAVGRVAWLRQGEYAGMGIQFVRVEEGDLNDVQAYLAGVSPGTEPTEDELAA